MSPLVNGKLRRVHVREHAQRVYKYSKNPREYKAERSVVQSSLAHRNLTRANGKPKVDRSIGHC